MSLWTSSDAADATGGDVLTDWQATGVSIDTRTLETGDLFVALKAARDGHEFVAQALEKGAAAALVSHIPDGVPDGAPLLLVDDVLAALERLGAAARARTQVRIVAITGSVGKTTTKEMLRTILADQGKTHASVASYNNHWGVPLTLARMPADTEFAVIEIGMNHPGEIAPLTKLARPHVALITTVAAAHLEAFDDITGIALEKAAIIEGLEYGGTAVMNCDIETAPILYAKAHDMKRKDVGFGRNGFDYVLKAVDVHKDVTVVQAEVDGEALLYKLGAPGAHFAMNALGALAAAKELGADLARAAQSLGQWTPYQGRGAREVIYLDPVEDAPRLELIDDSYNANPTSLAAALDVLAATTLTEPQGRRIAILGDMKELGPTGPDLHAAIAELTSVSQISTIHCVGPLMRHLHNALPANKKGLWVETADALAPDIRAQLHRGDAVMVKGSLSMKLATIVDAIRKMGHPRTRA